MSTRFVARSARSAVLLAILTADGWAHAAGAPVAEALFQQGRRLMSEGRTAEACLKLAESHRIEPATGTLLNLAACHEASGRLALAWAELSEALVRARVDRRPDREAYARQRLAALEPRLARLTIIVDQAVRRPELLVQLDGVKIGPAGWGVPAPVDPGAHEVRAQLPGMQPWSSRVKVTRPGEQLSVVVPRLDDALAGRGATRALADLSSSAARAGDRRWPWRKWGMVAAAGVTVGAVAAGTFFGVRAFAHWDERERYCPRGQAACSPPAVTAYREATRYARISDIAFGVGLASAAVGTFLYFLPAASGEPGAPLAGHRFDLAPLVAPGTAGLEASCAW